MMRLSGAVCAKVHSCSISDSADSSLRAACGSLHLKPIRLSFRKRRWPTPIRGGKGSEILIIADENSVAQFGDSSNERVRCVRRDTVAQQDYLVPPLPTHISTPIC